MRYGPLLFFGIFLTLAASWCGLVLIPQIQIGREVAVKIDETGEFYPPSQPGFAQQGLEVYRANGCIYCHSQQVREEGFGADILRNWGQRRTVARDYLNDKPVMLGTMRTGPDLTNIGARQASAEWHFLHLFEPRIPSRGSIMPPFRFLFVQQKIGPKPSPDALKLSGTFAPAPGCEIVPGPEAKALVQYLLNRKASAPLPEAK
jgi:cytochrome c oxidase cbb3-type subunit II